MNYYLIEVINIETEEIVHKIPCPTRPRAERVEQGVLINMDLGKYYTKIKYVQED